MCELMKQQETHLKQQVRPYILTLCPQGPLTGPHPGGAIRDPHSRTALIAV